MKHKTVETAVTETETKTEPATQDRSVGVWVYFVAVALFSIVYLVIAFSAPSAITLAFRGESYASFLDKWGTMVSLSGILWAGISLILMLAIGGVLSMFGSRSKWTRSIVMVLGVLPWLIIGIGLVFFSGTTADIGKLVVSRIGKPLFWSSSVVTLMAIAFPLIWRKR